MEAERMSTSRTTVLVLGGGPDAEREVSLASARGVAEGLRASGRYEVAERTIDRVTAEQLKSMPGGVIFPVLHGSYGEGGPLQDLLERDGRSYVGCGGRAARAAMDKMGTKLCAAKVGVPTPEACIVNLKDDACPLPFPVAVKPVHDGSSVGLHICRGPEAWSAIVEEMIEDVRAHPTRVYMVERFIAGRELTVGLIDGRALPAIHIMPAEGPYDYDAKYVREDTKYLLDPELPPGVDDRIKAQSAAVCQALGVRHLARADFMLDQGGTAWLLEVNTMPGFTSHSLVPKAAKHAGIEMPELCATLVDLAVRDRGAGALAASVVGLRDRARQQ
jgi:D-alanine-D-alanine ligase